MKLALAKLSLGATLHVPLGACIPVCCPGLKMYMFLEVLCLSTILFRWGAGINIRFSRTANLSTCTCQAQDPSHSLPVSVLCMSEVRYVCQTCYGGHVLIGQYGGVRDS